MKHTRKVVSLNLAFKELGAASVALTELMRGDLAKTANPDEVNAAYEKIEVYTSILFQRLTKVN